MTYRDNWVEENPDKILVDRIHPDSFTAYDNTIGEYYHCGATAEAQHVDRGVRVTLCGRKVAGLSWDFAIHFIENAVSQFSNKPQCPVCLNHPDIPLLLLGDLP